MLKDNSLPGGEMRTIKEFVLRSMNTLKGWFETIDSWASLGAMTMLAILMIYMVGQLLSTVAPLVTVLLVLFGTIHAVEKKRYILTFGGIALYGLSWPMVTAYGTWIGLSVWSAGVILWFAGVLGTFGIPNWKLPSHRRWPSQYKAC